MKTLKKLQNNKKKSIAAVREKENSLTKEIESKKKSKQEQLPKVERKLLIPFTLFFQLFPLTYVRLTKYIILFADDINPYDFSRT